MPDPSQPEPTRTAAHVPDPESTGPEPSAPTDTGPFAEAPSTSRMRRSVVAPGVPKVPGYDVVVEIARGGMGRVLRGRDLKLEREVAIKVLLPGLPVEEAARRFVRESRITAKLQHPGIPPIYELGTLADGSPFLAMKLIDGNTLAEAIKAPDRLAKLPRLVQVFEHICQAVAFAHERGVVHRDLKPANIMVGAFGEVQIMDWGLAKELRSADDSNLPAVEYADGQPTLDDSLPPLGGDATRPGTILGTLTYMAPEQARGEVHRVGPPADVFSLGGILCAILTGRAAYTGGPAEVAVKAELGMTDDALRRLEESGADRELVAIACKCLQKNPAERYQNGRALADAMVAYRSGVEQRLRDAERERVETAARAAERRKSRRVRQAVAVLAGVILLGAVGFAWWNERQDKQARLERAAHEAQQAEAEADRKALAARAEADRKAANAAREKLQAEAQAAQQTAAAQIAEQKAAQAQREAERDAVKKRTQEQVPALCDQAANLRRQYRFRAAELLLNEAGKLAADGLTPELVQLVEREKENLAFARDLDDIRMSKARWIVESSSRKGRFDTAFTPNRYQDAFRKHSLDIVKGNANQLAEQVKNSPIKVELLAALDDWAVYEPDAAILEKVLSVARKADPGPWTDRFRDPDVRDDDELLKALARDADPAALSPAVIAALADLMRKHDLNPSRLLLAAQLAHPHDFLIAFGLAQYYFERDPTKSIGHYLAARALRPDNKTVLSNLGAALIEKGDVDAAIAAYHELIKLDTKREDANARFDLGMAIAKKDDWKGAKVHFLEALAIDPKHAPAHAGLGIALFAEKDLDGALAQFRKALEIDDKLVAAYYAIGLILYEKKDYPGAIKSLKRAVELDPKNTSAYFELARSYAANHDWEEAEDAFREVLSQNEDHVGAHIGLGLVLIALGRLDESVEEMRAAVKLAPDEELAQRNWEFVLELRAERNARLRAAFGISIRDINP